MPHVVVHAADGRELGRFDLADAAGAPRRIVIGRAADCDLRIAHSTVSRHHCALVRDDDGEWTAHDLGSTHGTWFDGQRAASARIAADSTIRIGPAILRFIGVAARSSPPAKGPPR
ncbi:MAG: FHA domain-containing protein [Phycisphaeraceae bacterium]|nr:FHA domain-containing protein [Phycisphaeraceae bacterium]MBX3407870.1 FHA domain-containing protein [Phycisphaeraceae bacterium]